MTEHSLSRLVAWCGFLPLTFLLPEALPLEPLSAELLLPPLMELSLLLTLESLLLRTDIHSLYLALSAGVRLWQSEARCPSLPQCTLLEVLAMSSYVLVLIIIIWCNIPTGCTFDPGATTSSN